MLLSEFEYSNQPIITMLEYVRELKNATKERFLFEIVISHIVIVCSSSFVLPIRFDRFLNGWSETNEKKKRKNLSLISRWVCVSVAQLENRSDNNWRNKRRWDGAAVIRGIIEQTQRWTNSGMKASPSSYRTGWCNCSSRTSPACAVPSSPSIRPTCWTLWTVTAQWWKQ